MHICPVRGCDRPVPDDKLMCALHWRMVPSEPARELYAAWARGRGAGTERHQRAMDACVDHVDKALEEAARR